VIDIQAMDYLEFHDEENDPALAKRRERWRARQHSPDLHEGEKLPGMIRMTRLRCAVTTLALNGIMGGGKTK
jgi:hypothetical protein